MSSLQLKKHYHQIKKEQAKFTYSALGKVFEKQIKTIEYQGIKQVEALKALKSGRNQELESNEGLFLKKMRTNEIQSEINEIKQISKLKIKLKEKKSS